jgi:large subunit ribosomal protein L16
MMMPKKVKFRKQQRGRPRGAGLARAEGLVRRLRACRRSSGLGDGAPDRGRRIAMTRHVKRGGRSGSASSPTSRSPRSRSRPAWARARELRKSGCA